MVEVNHADVAWLYDINVLGDACSLTFIREVNEVEALRRLGASEDDIHLYTSDDCPLPEAVRAWQCGDWTVIIEVSDERLVDPEIMDAVSAGTEAIMIFENVNAWSRFEYLADGAVVTSFDPAGPDHREGNDPDRFVEEMRASGFDPDTGIEKGGAEADAPGFAGLLLLAARLTGVVLTPEIFNGPLPGACVKP
jgi:Family of unknown function (DUF6461)